MDCGPRNLANRFRGQDGATGGRRGLARETRPNPSVTLVTFAASRIDGEWRLQPGAPAAQAPGERGTETGTEGQWS